MSEAPTSPEAMAEHHLDFTAKLLRSCSDKELSENVKTYARLANISKLHADVFEMAKDEQNRRKKHRRS